MVNLFSFALFSSSANIMPQTIPSCENIINISGKRKVALILGKGTMSALDGVNKRNSFAHGYFPIA